MYWHIRSCLTFSWGSVECSLQSLYCAVANHNFLAISGITQYLLVNTAPALGTTTYTLFHKINFFQVPHISEITGTYLAVPDFFHFTYCSKWQNIIPFMDNSIPLYMSTTSSLFIVMVWILNISQEPHMLNAWSPSWWQYCKVIEILGGRGLLLKEVCHWSILLSLYLDLSSILHFQWLYTQ
jgi:hypothetical protein